MQNLYVLSGLFTITGVFHHSLVEGSITPVASTLTISSTCNIVGDILPNLCLMGAALCTSMWCSVMFVDPALSGEVLRYLSSIFSITALYLSLTSDIAAHYI